MKTFHTDIYDNGLNVIISAANAGTLKLVLNSAPPTTLTEANTTYRISDEIPLASADLTLQNGTSGGREIAVAAKSGTATATTGGTEDLHYSMYDGTRLLYVSDETTDQVITSGNPINFPAFKLGFNAPV